MNTLDFDLIPTTITTVIVESSITINLLKLYNLLHVTQKHDNFGFKDIVFKRYLQYYDGTPLKKKPNFDYFATFLHITLFIEKFIYVRISINGKMHILGCQSICHVQKFIEFIMDLIVKNKIYIDCKTKYIYMIFKIEMANKVFKIKYTINRMNLDMLINSMTPYISIYDPNEGSSAVNVKIPIEKNDLNDSYLLMRYNIRNCKKTYSIIPFNIYYNLVRVQDYKKISKSKFTTFLIFQSGSVNATSKNVAYMKHHFKIFQNLITDYRDSIEETLN
jgi:hypothetical protein